MDALGYLVRFVILPGQALDLTGVPDLLEDLPFKAWGGDKAFDEEWWLGDIEARGAKVVTP